MGVVLSRVVNVVLAVLIGAAYGTAATIAHAYRPAGVPVGLLLAIVGTAALLVAVRTLVAGRWGAFACGVGAVGATALFSGPGPGGSVIVPSGSADAIGWLNLGVVWLIAVCVLTVAAVAWPERAAVRSDGAN